MEAAYFTDPEPDKWPQKGRHSCTESENSNINTFPLSLWKPLTAHGNHYRSFLVGQRFPIWGKDNVWDIACPDDFARLSEAAAAAAVVTCSSWRQLKYSETITCRNLHQNLYSLITHSNLNTQTRYIVRFAVIYTSIISKRPFQINIQQSAQKKRRSL